MPTDRPQPPFRIKRPIIAAILLPLLFLSSLLSSARCSAATFTWNGSVSSDWFTANNWTPAGVPGSTDTINLTNGMINLTSSITIGGSFNWSGGSIGGSPMSIASGGVLNMAGSVILENTLTNTGTVTMTGNGSLTMYNNLLNYQGGVYNLAGALWDIQTNSSILCACYGNEFFNNAGVFRKSLGSGTSAIQVPFANAGMVTNLSGTLNFGAGGALSGAYDIASGATIDFGAGNFTMGVPPVFSGAGLCEFTGTTLTLNQNVPPNLVLAGGSLILGPAFQNAGGITNLTLSGATLAGANSVTGTLSWNGGTVAGPLTIAGAGVLNIAGNVILAGALTNTGTVTMTGNGSVTLYNNLMNYHGGINNLAGALWDIQTNASVLCACYGNEFFNNAGVLRKSLGSGTSAIQVPFANAGTVTNLRGILSFGGGGVLSGGYDTASGATITFSAGNFSMGVPPVITGGGLCEFNGTTLTLNQTVPPNLALAGGNLILGPAFQNAGGITNFTLSGATLAGVNSVTGTLSWNGGTVAGPLTIAGAGVLNIAGNVILAGALTNTGTVTMTGNGSVTLYNNLMNYHGGIYNLAGALWDIQTNASISCACYGNEFFNNGGVLRKSLGSGTSAIQVSFANAGTVTNLSGTLSFGGGGVLSGGYDTAAGASITFSAGSFTMGVPPVITGGGLCEFNGTMLTLNQTVPPNLVLAGGSLILGPAFQNAGGITNLMLSGATLAGTNNVTGTLTWSGGTITTPLTIAGAGVLNIAGNIILANALTNAGTVTMTGNGSVTLYNNLMNYHGGIYNLAGALWDIQTNASILCACYGHEFFNNAGVLRKSLGSGTSAIQVGFTNAGTVDALVGTLNFSAGFSSAGGTLAFGASGLNSFGLMNISGAVALNGTASVAWLNGFTPAVGNSFALLDYGSQSGSFANLTFPPGTLGLGNYGATVFSVTITSFSTLPAAPVLSIELVNPNTVIILWPTAAANFGLQTSANMAPGSWSDVLSGITTVGTNYTLTKTTGGAAAFYRLQSQ